ncbi:MAG: peptidoglycan DD-metalloendopeptidase family protein [Coxiellaceae bacterium]|nr:peptidoglycan DD-metalloendopeptidase family protein [Coxiellaceae bacterium]
MTGCIDDDRVAPVVNAWYQKKAASNFYVVQEDDTIYSIAFAFGLDYRALVKANNLMPPYPLTPGQRLTMTNEPPTSTQKTIKSTTVGPEASVVVAVNPMPEPIHTPVAAWVWPTKGELIQNFSTRPDGHPGISITGKVGQRIRAAANGIVVYSGDGVRGYGNLIIIKHNETYLSAYAFNQQNLVTTGDRVQAGQVIARMGQNDAGRSLLYFEIRRNGLPVNPLKFLM